MENHMTLNMLVVEHLVEKLMALALGLIVLLVFSNVVGRYALGTSFAGAEELSRLLFVWLVFLGAILTLRRRAHLGVELVQARLPRWARKICSVITHVLTLYALWLFLEGSWAQTQIGLSTYSTVLRFPNAFIASAGLVCAASMILIVASNLLKIAINHPGAVMAGDPPAQADSLDAGITKESVTGVSQ
jgi:TRAP-type C4-dicarboxylate transport system permease small subunit